MIQRHTKMPVTKPYFSSSLNYRASAAKLPLRYRTKTSVMEWSAAATADADSIKENQLNRNPAVKKNR
jgi:hypothetical protein